MRAYSSLALLNAIYSFTLAAAGSLPRGVSPEYASHYQDKDQFTCITNAAIKLSLNQVNDNSCDCPDGSDEPGTAACAHLDPLSPEQPLPGSSTGTTKTANALPGFWCANEGHIGSYVPFSYVNDGVCDYDLCCDGSEEYAHKGGVKCENKCAQIGKEHRRLETEKKNKMDRAQKKRKTMLSEASELRRRVEAKAQSLKSEVAALEAKKADLQRKFEEAEKEEKTKVVRGEKSGSGGKLGVLVGLAKARVEELRNTLDKVVRQRDELRGRVEELETVLSKFKEEYNPNFNDAGVKAAAKSWEDYAAREQNKEADTETDADIQSVLAEDTETNGVNWKEFEGLDEGTDTDVLYTIEAYLPPFARAFVHSKLEGIHVWMIENGMLADKHEPGTESTLVKAAREAVEAAEKELKQKSKELTSEEEDLNKDYGPSDIFRSIKDKCTSIEAGEYTYELCWLGKTSQKSKKGHGNTGMGNFKSIDWEEADDEERLDGRSLGKGRRMVLRYDDGQQCWNGPRRRTDVWLGCAETEEVWRVTEAEKCVYKMEVGTPAACDPEEGGVKQESTGKDEL